MLGHGLREVGKRCHVGRRCPPTPACPPLPRAFRVRGPRSVENLGFFFPKGSRVLRPGNWGWGGQGQGWAGLAPRGLSLGRMTAEGNSAQTVTQLWRDHFLPPVERTEMQTLCRVRRERASIALGCTATPNSAARSSLTKGLGCRL